MAPAPGLGEAEHGRALLASSRGAVSASRELAGPGRRPLEVSRAQVLSGLPERVEEPAPAGHLVELSDLVVAGRYVPAGAGSEPIAGDFYDLLMLAPDRLGVVLGDVSGHGLSAAARMLALRAAVRAAAPGAAGPRALLHELDAFLEAEPDEWLATVWYAEYTPSSGRLVYASAGHPPPVLTCNGEATRLLQLADAPPLGIGVAHSLAVEHTLVLPPGSVLVAYSDGLVERHDRDLTSQLALLLEVVERCADPAVGASAQQVADAILAALVPVPEQADDDVCLMVVRRQPPVHAPLGEVGWESTAM